MEDCDDIPAVSLVNVRSYVSACYYLVLNVARGIWATIFAAKNFKVSRDQTVTRSAVFLIFTIVVLTIDIIMWSRDRRPQR